MSADQMSEKQFEHFIKSIKDLEPKRKTQSSSGNISNCDTSFSGERDLDAVENFIAIIETYKDKEHINDEDALKGLPLLFVDDAATWWKGVQRQVKTWQEAMTMLREYFSPTMQPYQIYLEIFETGQGDRESIDSFVCRKRALLAKLPESLHSEETELNFLYGLLAPKYRQHMPRKNIKTFKALLKNGRRLEKNA